MPIVFRYMYVTSQKAGSGRIVRYTMDGKKERVLVTGLASPKGLAIDLICELFSLHHSLSFGLGCVFNLLHILSVVELL